MVITSTSGTTERTVSADTAKLRRSRRLSSTRGWKPRNSKAEPPDEPRQDLNQKLGLCPIVSKSVDDNETRKRFLINWELNERISLSSGSSTGLEVRPDMRRGIETRDGSARSKNSSESKTSKKIGGGRRRMESETRLDTMNVSGFPEDFARKHRGSWSIAIDVVKGANSPNDNVLKSDSKYEMGLLAPNSIGGKTKERRPTTVPVIDTARSQRSSKVNDNANCGSCRRSGKQKHEKSNDSISKRLELIHELNQKILANYERFQQRSRKNRGSKNGTEETLRKDRTTLPPKGQTLASENSRGRGRGEHVYSEVKRKNRTGDSANQFETNKFTFSRDYCEKLVSSKDKLEEGGSKSSSSKGSAKNLANKDGCNVNENFSLAVKSNFCEEGSRVRNKISKSDCPASSKVSGSSKEASASEKGFRPSSTTTDDFSPGGGKCLETCKLYPERNSHRKDFKDNASREMEIDAGPPETARPHERNHEREPSDAHSSGEEDTDDQEALEREILQNFNETIDKFDNDAVEQRLNSSSGTSNSNSSDKCESFSTDSIQASSPLPTKKSPNNNRNNNNNNSNSNNSLIETFNSSWDSGVGVEVGTGSGWIRIHTGIESSLVYLTLDTTAKDVCRDMLLGDDLSLFIQYGGEPGRRLRPHEKPLELQDHFLQILGYQDISRRARLGVDPELRHLIAFHVGPASPSTDLTGYSRCGYALVLKGLVFPQWKRRPLAIIGSRLFLYPACPDSQPEWMELGCDGGGAVCYAPSRLGKLVLRVTGYPKVTQQQKQQQQQQQPSRNRDFRQEKEREEPEVEEEPEVHHKETRHLYLGFHHPWDRDLWKGWIKQATQLSSCPKRLDLSKAGLSRIPDSVVAFPAIEELVLSQNHLTNSDNNFAILHRFPRLTSIHLENNCLELVPLELLDLTGLTYLNLSDNKIENVPVEISLLINLTELILDRNGIKELPNELCKLRNLRSISAVGNYLSNLPPFLNMRALALTEVLSKGDHGKAYKDEKNNQNNLHKINLRNNQLKGNIILGNYGNLTHLDVSENSIEKLDIGALHELKSVRCARNLLTELTLCGRNLVSLIAGNNRLKKLTIEPVPSNLEHLDISYNNLDALPEWTPDLPVLRALFASHNALTALPDRLLSQPSRLEVLHLPHNRLQALPPPRRPLNIVHLTLQGNALTALPGTFFANTEKMKVLNLSNNRLSELPYCNEVNKNRHGSHTLEKLYITANCLTDTALDALAKFPALRVLHIAYNVLDTLPESCIASWVDLEELVLSGNRLQYLPDNVANLKHLRVLRVHSNRLLTCPMFNKMTSLKVLDLAHNQLDRINLANLVPPQLQFLDISCNSRLHVDPRQFQVYRSQRQISLVDVSGQNRPSLPSHPHQQEIVSTERNGEQPWRLGFSETAGSREKLYISQVRMPAFCNVEGLFGIFDGGSNQEAPGALQEMIPRLLLEERTVRETSKEYLKYTLLSAHRELKDKGQKYGIDATLIHIVKSSISQSYSRSPVRYTLKVASSGEAKAVLCRAAGPLTLAPPKKISMRNQLGNAAMFPLVVPDPITEEVALEDDDEFVIIANRRLWEVLSIQEAVREARAEASPVLAAKRLQDLAQAYGAEDNISVVVVRLTGPGPGDLDQLMRELRHAVGKNRSQGEGMCSCPCCLPPTAHKPPGPCCCHANEGYYLNGVLKNIVNRSGKCHGGSGRYFKNTRPVQENESPPYRDDRSSPSGQSDQASDSTFKSRHPSGRLWTGSAVSRATNKARQSVLAQENGLKKGPCYGTPEDAVSERSGALSEEQFRCWEYMLEQNTQLLFDKELDTLTRTPLRRGQSRSTPQLAGNLPFLSKRFGSARSFNPALPRPPVVRFGSGRRLLNGGPNAAYFGSLQRLMPYNLEYDFAVIQERAGLDSLEQDATRMQQYWGVATTEL